MDRLSHLRGEAGSSRDSTLDTTSPPSEAFTTANESSSKYFSLSEVDSVDSTFDISSIKDVSLATNTTDSEGTITNTDDLISNLSPIGKKSDMLESYKIGKQIEAANILSGGVDIFDDNDNSYDGDELVIDDNVDIDEKSNSELKQPESMQFKSDENIIESTLISEETDIASKDTEVVLQIDGKNVDAIDIGNGLYLYRKEGQEELAAVQIIDDDQQQTSFKFLKVRENAEGNLEVYEEIEIEVPEEVPAKEGRTTDKKISSHVPIKDINKVISESACNKVAERKNKIPIREPISTITEVEFDVNKETSPDGKSEVNFNGKMKKFSESRKSPVIGSFTPMTYHSTPNKEGIPLTKTMVDQQLHPNRHSDNVKKTIEVHTDNCKQRSTETPIKNKDSCDNKINEATSTEKEIVITEFIDNNVETGKYVSAVRNIETDEAKRLKTSNDVEFKNITKNTSKLPSKDKPFIDKCVSKDTSILPREEDNIIDSTEKDSNKDKSILEVDLNKQNDKVEKENIVNIEESMDTDMEIVETVADSLSVKSYLKTKEPVKVDSGNKQCQDNDNVKSSEPLKVNEDKIEIDQSNIKNKVIEKSNIQADSQGVKKVEEIVYDITDQDVEEIIIIDESEIDETKIEGQLPEPENVKSKEEFVKVESNISNKNTNKVEESIQDNNKKETKHIEIDLIPSDTQNENYKKEEVLNSALSEDVKKSQSKIPLPQSDTTKVKTKPVSSELTEKEQSCKLLEVKPEMREIKVSQTIKNEAVKEFVVEKTPSDEPQKISVTLDNNTQVEPKLVQKVVANKTPTFVSSIPTKTENEGQMKDKVPEKHLKIEPKNTTKVSKSQPIGAPTAVEASTSVKAGCSGKNSVTITKVPRRVEEERKLSPLELSQPTPESKLQVIGKKDEKQEIKIDFKDAHKNVKVNKMPKEEEPQPSCSGTQDVSSTSAESHSFQNNETKTELEDNKDDTSADEAKPGTSKKAVPFGKWTATNRKEFLIKIKNRNTAPVATPSTSNQLKNSNDLNRRDVLQKIDSQRQSSSALAKTQEANKLSIKNETAFVSKTSIIHKDNNTQESKVPLNTDVVEEASKSISDKDSIIQDLTNDTQNDVLPGVTVTSVKKDAAERTEVNYQKLIDKTIEGMIHRTVVPLKAPQEEPDINSIKDPNVKYPPNYEPTDQATLDAIEMKMNELHGIPFIERPPHELPVVPLSEVKTYSKADIEKQLAANKTTKVPKLLPFPIKTQHKIIKENVLEVDSEEEIIEHEPITGDIVINKKHVAAKLPTKEKLPSHTNTDKSTSDTSKKESIITEKDFDKFARRNSITYENCLTVNFERKESHNVIKTVVEKDSYPKSHPRNDIARVDHKAKMPYKYQNVRQSIQPAKGQTTHKFGSTTEDSSNRNQSKLQKAYHSALTAKRQMECPITIIEDKPVKVVFMDNVEFIPNQLNVQRKDLSPVKKLIVEPDNFTISTLDSLESDLLDTNDDAKSQEDVKTKTKHQRKQVLTPVDEPELELIEPNDLGIEVSPKKKRKTEEDKADKNAKYPMRKKYYLLGSNTATEEKFAHTADMMKNPLKETLKCNDNGVAHKNVVSAIDNLVKAAELLEHQSENMNIVNSPNLDSQQSSPVKRGRGRPRKYPLPEGVNDNKVPSPQKKPRLIDAKVPKPKVVKYRDTTTDEDDESDDEIIKENWTMGKINENIVCPICNKLFRTENVVFKHVKHCTGPSPSRSDSDKRSPRRIRPSQESEESKSHGSKSDDMDIDDDKPLVRKETPKKRKSKDSVIKSSDDKDDVIVIEDTPIKEKVEKEVDERKHHESRKPKAKLLHKNNDLVCEFCGKSFRQLSYLVNHKLQHKKDEPTKIEKEGPIANKSVYSCEFCKKEFRKLHHLVQHRVIHNPTSVPARSLRKSSSENSDKIEKETGTSKQSEDQSAGFRCEPCDKSFRKLHHLVEHRETHDGINRQKTTIPVVQNNVEKPISLHQCDVCKKTFRKLHHLIEHKELHVETSSEKSDDKSVKSSLSTKDIIHECSLCYMVFPNEHSLTKHTIICQRKKRQSKLAKTTVVSESVELVEDGVESGDGSKIEEKSDDVNLSKPVIEEVKDDKDVDAVVGKNELSTDKPKAAEEKPTEIVMELEKETESVPQKTETKPVEPQIVPAKRDFAETENVKKEEKPEVPEKIRKVDVKETTKVHETPKKKTVKDKPIASASKRLKTTIPDPIPNDVKPSVESSDDDEVRYMLNPNFKVEDTVEEKVFMKVRANKRSSLQIERPNSKDLVKRRTSLQHPPKIPRLKPKPVQPATVIMKNVAKTAKLESVPSTDSDDSETTKYSFPKTIPENSTKPTQDRTPKNIERKTQKKLLSDKRKSLSGIAKRKSLGKVITARHKPSPIKPIKRRTLGVEHRCDCGQLFSSAALLSRHTTLAHTPPRIRRRRSPPPEEKPHIKPAPRKSNAAEKPKQTPASRKSSVRSDSTTSTNTKPNRGEGKSTSKTPADTRKSKLEKSEEKSSVKPRRTGAHRGVPVPEKMRKLMEKNNK